MRSFVEIFAMRISSPLSRSVSALSTLTFPCEVSRTKTTRLSLSWGRRSTKPCSTSLSTRLVMVPLVTNVSVNKVPIDNSYGAPARRSAARTSKAQVSNPCASKALRRAISRWRAIRVMRESTARAERSSSGRSRLQAATIWSTWSRVSWLFPTPPII